MMRIRGLIFRELYLGRKNYLLTTAIWIMVAIFGILMRLSMLYGNMSTMPAESLANSENNLYNIFIFAPALILMSSFIANSDSLFSDFSSKWAVFSCATPVSEYKYVGVRYIIKVIMIVLSLCLSFANAAILCCIYERHFTRLIIGFILLFLILTIIISTSADLLAYKYKDKNKVSVRLITGALLVYFIIMFYIVKSLKSMYPDDINNESNEALKAFLNPLVEVISNAVPFMPFIILLLLTAGYFLSVRAMKRRNF